MGHRPRRSWLRPLSARGTAIAVAAACALPAATARAGDRDLVMSRLGTVITDGAAAVGVIGSNQEFRALASELGVVMAPRLLTPADTLGFGGFQFTVDLAFTGISSDAAYWRALQGSPDPTGVGGLEHGDALQPTLGCFVRKGIWLPLPSFEVAAGATHLLESNIWAAQGYAKLALHEGYHDLPVPSAAARLAASRVMGSDQIDMTVASLDLSLSKDFGVAGTFTASPYAGWNYLWIIARSEVIDKTPQIDARAVPSDLNQTFVFVDQDDITRQRVFGGLKLRYAALQLTLEAVFALAGSSTDDRPGTDLDCANAMPTSPTANCDATDAAGSQVTYTASVGFDF